MPIRNNLDRQEMDHMRYRKSTVGGKQPQAERITPQHGLIKGADSQQHPW